MTPFATRSELAVRHPADVPLVEQRDELEQSVRERAEWFARDVAKGRIKPDQVARHERIWTAIVADHAALGTGAPIGADTPGVTWEDKVAELRRELAIRRNAWPKRIGKPHGLTATEAARRFDCLDAVHYRYWHRLFAFTAPGIAPATDAHRIAFIATREAERARRIADRHARQSAPPSQSLLAEPTFLDQAAPPRGRHAATIEGDRAAVRAWHAVAAVARDWIDMQPIDPAKAAPAAEFVLAELCRAMTPAAKGEPVDEARVALLGQVDQFMLTWCDPTRAQEIIGTAAQALPRSHHQMEAHAA